MKKKLRADQKLVEFGFAENIAKAQAYIMAGGVEREHSAGVWVPVAKAGDLFSLTETIRLKENFLNPDVGRGAQKLRKAFELWEESNPKNCVCMDIGSSTGGFTQVLLELGAKKVLALDVGTHQLHEKLRRDPRVISVEETHVLKVADSDFEKWGVRLPLDRIVCDVSFMSVTRVIEVAASWMASGGHSIFLIKPQFELEPSKTPSGIVTNPVHREEAIQIVKATVDAHSQLVWRDLSESPIKGGDGNVEFLLWISKK